MLDDEARRLERERGWSGTLAPTGMVTTPYAVAVIASDPQLINNTARIGVPGYPVIERTEAILADACAVYPPILLRRW